MKNQKGFAIPLLVAIVTILAIGGGVYVYKINKVVAPESNIATTTATSTIVGNDRDAHGCIGSAGYTWCQVKNKCLRVWEEKCGASSTTEEKVTFKISGGYDGGICTLVNTNRKTFLPEDAKQYLCEADSIQPYQFYRYLYPTGGIYQGQIPNGKIFSKNIKVSYFVDEHFIDTHELKTLDQEWLDIGCYDLKSNLLCNQAIKIFLNGTSTYEQPLE